MTIQCSNCNALNDDIAATCIECGAQLSAARLTAAADAIDRATKKPIGSIALLVVGAIYLLNPLFGFDLLPDNLPVIGNIDEVVITYLIMQSMGKLGWNVFPLAKLKSPDEPK